MPGITENGEVPCIQPFDIILLGTESTDFNFVGIALYNNPATGVVRISAFTGLRLDMEIFQN